MNERGECTQNQQIIIKKKDLCTASAYLTKAFMMYYYFISTYRWIYSTRGDL